MGAERTRLQPHARNEHRRHQAAPGRNPGVSSCCYAHHVTVRSLSVARACARIDSGPDKAKICSDRRVDPDRHRLRAVFGERKTFLHSLDHFRTLADATAMSALPP
jgi:hypothetical protein